MLLAGLNPDSLAEDLFGLTDRAFQSPLALALGNRFESRLYRNGASRLVDAYIAIGRLDPKAQVADLTKVLDPLSRTRGFIEARLRGESAPDVIVQGAMSLAAFGAPDSLIRPDVLVAEPGEHLYRVGEVKSYESREGFTDEDDIESSAAQAAVALLTLQHLSVSYQSASVVDIILRRPSTLLPIVHSIPAERDLYRLRLIARADRCYVDNIISLLDAQRSTTEGCRAAIEAIPTNYDPTCLQRCGFAYRCRSEARDKGNPCLIDRKASTICPTSLDALVAGGQLPDSYEGNLLRRAITAADEAIECSTS